MMQPFFQSQYSISQYSNPNSFTGSDCLQCWLVSLCCCDRHSVLTSTDSRYILKILLLLYINFFFFFWRNLTNEVNWGVIFLYKMFPVVNAYLVESLSRLFVYFGWKMIECEVHRHNKRLSICDDVKAQRSFRCFRWWFVLYFSQFYFVPYAVLLSVFVTGHCFHQIISALLLS